MRFLLPVSRLAVEKKKDVVSEADCNNTLICQALGAYHSLPAQEDPPTDMDTTRILDGNG